MPLPSEAEVVRISHKHSSSCLASSQYSLMWIMCPHIGHFNRRKQSPYTLGRVDEAGPFLGVIPFNTSQCCRWSLLSASLTQYSSSDTFPLQDDI